MGKETFRERGNLFGGPASSLPEIACTLVIDYSGRLGNGIFWLKFFSADDGPTSSSQTES
jgi:hypothetical protein